VSLYLLAKSQPTLFHPGLLPQTRTDKHGHTQRRWLRHQSPNDREAAGAVRYFLSTSSSLHGHDPMHGVMVNARTTGIHAGVKEGRQWAMDNGAYSGHFDPVTLTRAMQRFAPYRRTCRFVVAPDTLNDGAQTARDFPRWRATIRAAGYPAAYVSHAGGPEQLPNCDALFVPALNLSGPEVPGLIAQARAARIPVHLGRVNSAKRMQLAHDLGINSADGTHSVFKGVEQASKDAGQWTASTEARAKEARLFAAPREVGSAQQMPPRAALQAVDHAYQDGAQPPSAGLEPYAHVIHVPTGRRGVLLDDPDPDDGALVYWDGEDADLSRVPIDELLAHGGMQ